MEGEALKAYGDQLGNRIVELEKEIYDMAGETFNINSPKQLGVILFEKLEMPHAKKTKTGILQQQMYWISLHPSIRSWQRFWNIGSLQS